MKKLFLSSKSLRSHIFIGIILVVVLTALASGLPAIWLVYSQLEQQAWERVWQGVRASRSLYKTREEEMTRLVTFTAQRPTLQMLLTKVDQEALLNYLNELQTGENIDAIVICGSDGRIMASTQTTFIDSCEARETPEYIMDNNPSSPGAWLVAASDVQVGSENLGRIILGLALNDSFVQTMRSQTGLEHAIYWDDYPLAASIEGGREALTTISRESSRMVSGDGSNQTSYWLGDRPYFSTRFPVNQTDLSAEVALDIGGISEAQRRSLVILVGGILAVTAMALFLGALLAKQISQPLEALALSAESLSLENLESSFAVHTPVVEVNSVARAFENARLELKQSLVTLQEEKDWSDRLLESIVEGIITLDAENHIQYFSSGAERITGWGREQVLQHSIDEVLITIDKSKPFSAQIPSPGEKRVIVVALPARRQATLAVTEAQLPPSEVSDSRIALVFRDVSEEEAVNRLLGQFLGNVAHEFRTPLSALAASLELLMDQYPDLTDSEVQELLNSLQLGILSLETLIDNLLESANIEARRFQVIPHPSDIRDIVADAIQTIQPLLEKYGQKLVLKYPTTIPLVCADARRTMQVMVNMLSNASKYGPNDSEINIELNVELDFVRVAVSDRGPGIPREYHDDLFYRLIIPKIQSDKAKPGAGLGLSVVKSIVEAQRGRAGYQDREAGGATFWFTLPVAKEL